MLLYSIMIHLVQSRVGEDSEIVLCLVLGTLLAVDRGERTLPNTPPSKQNDCDGQTTMFTNTDEDDAKEDHKEDSDVDNGETCMHTMRTGASI